jgi:hypothetical protein
MDQRRLAFVGQREYFAYCALEQPAGGVEPAFFDHRSTAPIEPLRRALEAFAPDVVLVFRPELIPAGGFEGLDAVTIGYLTEPLPRVGNGSHFDLDERLDHLRRVDAGSFDRFCSFDPLIAATVEPFTPIWRSFPIPVSDRYFGDARTVHGPPRLLFTGRSTDHRERFLLPLKHDFDVVHLAHGVGDERLIEFFDEVDVGLNIHNHPYPTFENRVCAYMAAGLLVISEPLSPYNGLRPGIDLLIADQPWAMWELVHQMTRTPDAFAAVRRSGRRAAERFRASHVYPRLVGDVLADVAAFGGRQGHNFAAADTLDLPTAPLP